MKIFELRGAISAGRFDMHLADVYGGKAQAMSQRGRYCALLDSFESAYPGGDSDIRLFSSPGRTEVSGNHTDHNHGKVLAASIDLDSIAAVRKTDDSIINAKSIGNGTVKADLSDLSVHEEEKGTSAALVRGICAAFNERGYKIGGFDAVVASQVIIGSGLSSSASYEVLIATILNNLYNNGKIKQVELAQISQYAENVYFGKPCGLMDQTACAVGGFVFIDFKDPKNPVIQKIEYDYEDDEYILCIVDTGGSHSDLTAEYSAIRSEMCAVAKLLGGEVLREVPSGKLAENMTMVRNEVGDRALQRAMHFYLENDRVAAEVRALIKGDFTQFLSLVQKSGDSSFKHNQNVYTSVDSKYQPVALALALCDYLLDGKGASRVHGGGFAGTVMAFVQKDNLHRFTTEIKKVFGEKSCYILSIRTEGSCEV